MASTVTFAALTLALIALWAPCLSSSRGAARWWMYPFALALVAAVAGELVDVRGLLVVFAFAGACLVASRASTRLVRAVAHVVMLVLCAGLMLHVMPGFDNPRALDRVILSSDSEPYTKYLNVDKGIAGLLLLGVYAPERTARDDGLAHVPGFLWRFAAVAVIAMALAFAAGYVRWDPKLPSWWALWMWSMVCLTALPEEALFRGVAQTGLERWLRRMPRATLLAVVLAGTLFGVAHVGGGLVYVLLAAAAGIGYGWIYAATRSIGAAVIAHAGLNTIHFLFFSYPALSRPLSGQ